MSDAIIRKSLNADKTPANSSYTVYAGNTVLLTFNVADENGQALDLTGWTMKYKLRPQAGGEVWAGGKTVTISSDPANVGQATLQLEVGDTTPLNATYNHFLVLTDASGKVGTFMTGQATFQLNGV